MPRQPLWLATVPRTTLSHKGTCRCSCALVQHARCDRKADVGERRALCCEDQPLERTGAHRCARGDLLPHRRTRNDLRVAGERAQQVPRLDLPERAVAGQRSRHHDVAVGLIFLDHKAERHS
eukprot:scaffold72425_cov32-Tisochrysis_lutea.AAC.2